MQQFYRFKTIFLYLFIIFSFSAKGQITFVFWNIKDFGQSRNKLKMEAIAQVIRHADIVANQEVVAKHQGCAQAIAKLPDRLDRMGAKWDYKISDPTQSSSPQKSEKYAYLCAVLNFNLHNIKQSLLSLFCNNVDFNPVRLLFKIKKNLKKYSNNKFGTINRFMSLFDNLELNYILQYDINCKIYGK